MTIPAKEGFYWAKWKINDDTIDPMFDTASPTALWEVMELYQNDNNEWYVWLMGVPGTQPAENFFWGPGPLEAPPRRPMLFDPDKEKQHAARRAYQNMTPDQREEFLQEQRRKL